MKIEFIEAAEATGLKAPDVYYSAGYGLSAEVIDGGVWECAVAEGGRFAFPYIRRPVPGGANEYDLVSPYGYAGVVAPNPEVRAAFVRAARDAGRERGLVTEFLRTNPFDVEDPQTAGMEVDAWRTHPTFVVEVDGLAGLKGYWDGAEGRFRTAVRKAQRTGVQISEVDPGCLVESASPFRTLYDSTMERVGSSGRLKLPDDYYARLVQGLGDRVVLYVADIEGEPVAASLFLRWGDRLHYHLSGSSAEGMRSGATNALLDHGTRTLLVGGGRLHLGGGVRPGDGLDRFKRSMASHETSIHLCRTVVNKERYDALVAESGADPTSDYFPAYRG